MSNIAASSFEHKKRICASEATLLLMHLLRTTNFDIHREAAYTLGNLCVVPVGSSNPLSIIMPPNEGTQLATKYRGQGFQNSEPQGWEELQFRYRGSIRYSA